MDQELKKARHYLETGILGAYETAEVACVEEQDGKYAPCFDDATIYFDKTQITIQRRINIEGKCFRVCSVFPAESSVTPTDKLLNLIDADAKKDN